MSSNRYRGRFAATFVFDSETHSHAITGLLDHQKNGGARILEEWNPDGISFCVTFRGAQHVVNEGNQSLTLILQVHHGAQATLASVWCAERILEPLSLKLAVAGQPNGLRQGRKNIEILFCTHVRPPASTKSGKPVATIAGSGRPPLIPGLTAIPVYRFLPPHRSRAQSPATLPTQTQ